MWKKNSSKIFQTLILDKKRKKKEEPILLSHSSSRAQQLNISSTFILIEKLVIWF